MHGRMHRARWIAALVGIIAISGSSLTNCGGRFESDALDNVDQTGPTTTAVPKPGGHLIYGLESDPNGFDPTRNAWDNAGLQVANALYDPLVAVNNEGRFMPYLAESFAPSDDFTSWLLRVRPNISFSNGRALNADALVIWANAIRSSVITGPPAKLISDVRKVDELTIQVVTSRPWATLPALLSGQGGYIVAPEQLVDTEGHSHPIGTGPFTLSRWQQDKQISVVRNPHYWRQGLPYLNAVDFVIEPFGTRRIERIQAGDMDVTNVTLPWDLRTLDQTMATESGKAQLRVERDKGDAEKSFVMFNTSKPPLNDVRVRQALAYATDMGQIAAQSGWRLDEQAQGPLSPDSPFFSSEPYPSYNPDKARSLLNEYLADTSVRGRREVSFVFTAPSVEADYLHMMVDQWSRVGIKVELALVDVKMAVRLAVSGQYDAMLLRYFAAPDPDVLWHFFVSDTISDGPISLNFTRFANADITDGMYEGRSTTDLNVRRPAYAKVQKVFAEQMPYLWLNRSEWRVVTSARVHDAHNVSLPDRSPAMPLLAGTHRLTETWLDR
jgi:peptide/nickel transport system substrate-binding protein